MRRRTLFYLVLGIATALLIVTLATWLQTGGSPDPNVWLRAHKGSPLLQMLDLAAGFLFVVIGLYGLTVSRLQTQIRHQAEDAHEQMQKLIHRNEELAKVNDEYAEQIAALETHLQEPPQLTDGGISPPVVERLRRQVEAQAQQLESVHLTLEEQHTELLELRESVQTLAESAPLRLAPAASATPHTASPPDLAELEPTPVSRPIAPGIPDATRNDRSTLIGEMLDFEVAPIAFPDVFHAEPSEDVRVSEPGTYPVDDSLLAVVAGHMSSIPDPVAPQPAPAGRSETTTQEAAPASLSPDRDTEAERHSRRTEAREAFDVADSALSSLHNETQEALSSLRAQVEASLPRETIAPIAASAEKPNAPSRPKPWRLRF